jgi:hypothetical protein
MPSFDLDQEFPIFRPIARSRDYRRESDFSTGHQAISDSQENAFDTRISAQFLVQAIDGLCGFVLRIYYPAMLEHVVEDNQAIGSKTRKNELVIQVIAGFVRVDEGKIEHGFRRQRLEFCPPTPKAQFDLTLNAGAPPVALGDAGPMGIDVDAKKASLSREAPCDANGAVAGERSDFDGGARPQDGHQQRQERPLFAADEHFAGGAKLFGFGPQVIEYRVARPASMSRDISV